MDASTRQYLITALWASSDDIGNKYGLDDLAPETVARAERDCALFRAMAGDMLALDHDPECGAGDFWLTRNGHGAGFWDGDWGTHGNPLTLIADVFGETYLYAGDDGRIFFF